MSQPQTNTKLVITGVLLALLMASLDNTIVSTAMPTVVKELGGLDIFSWVFSAYLLTSTTFIPIFGKLADLYGKKRFYLLGLVIFIIGSALCSYATTMHQLIAFRALQGVGSAAVFPITFALIMTIFPPEKRAKMQGLFSAVFGISSVAGPQVGAYFTDHLTWHWIFLVNLPIGLISVLLISVFFKEAKGAGKKVVIDYAGAFTLALAIVSLMFGLVMGGNEYAWGSWQILSLLIGAGVLTALFLFVETKAKEPIIPLRLFSAPVVSATGQTFFQGAIMMGATTYIPLFIQGVIGGTASNAGNLITPMTVSTVVGATFGGFMMQKIPFRILMGAAGVLMTAGASLLSRLAIDTTSLYVIGSMIVLGLGIGLLMPTTTMLTQLSVGRENIGVATSMVTFFRNIGMTIWVSIFGVIVNNKMADGLTSALKGIAIPPQFADKLKDPRVLLQPEARAHIPKNVFEMLQGAMSSAIAEVFLVCIGLAILCFLCALLAGKTRFTVPGKGQGQGPAAPPAGGSTQAH